MTRRVAAVATELAIVLLLVLGLAALIVGGGIVTYNYLNRDQTRTGLEGVDR